MNWSEIPWIVKLAGLWVLVNFMPARRVMAHARRLDRSPEIWFVVSLVFSAVPFIFVATRTRRAQPERSGKGGQAGGIKRCPHCRGLFNRRELTPGGRCPLCGLSIPKENVA